MTTELAKSARQMALKLEQAMRQLPTDQLIETEVVHRFSHKAYVRQMTLPKGVCAVGKIHKFKQVNIILSGHISILTDEGVVEIVAPYVFTAQAGAKRAAYAHEDTVWLTVHGTELTDPDLIEEEIIAKSFEEFEQLCLELKS